MRHGQPGRPVIFREVRDLIRKILNWFVNNDDKYILIVNDDSLVDWIRLKDGGENPTDAIADVYRTLRESSQ